MRYYITTTSERASKGQGGQKYVAAAFIVEHDTGERETMLTLVLTRHGDTFTLQEQRSAEVFYSIPVKK